MNSTLKKYLIFLMLILVGIVLLEFNKPKNTNWDKTRMSVNSKNPFGLYIFNREIDKMTSKFEVTRFDVTPYTFLEEASLDTIQNSTLLLISYYDKLGYVGADYLLDFIARGNTAFLSSSAFNFQILDTLGLDYSHLPDYTPQSLKTRVWTLDKKLASAYFDLDKAFETNALTIPDSLRNKIEILGYQEVASENKKPNFIRYSIGEGQLFLHTQPLAFSNYTLLQSNNHLYVENLLSYLPEGKIYWQVDQLETSPLQSESLMRFILSEPGLKSAWYLLLCGLLVFIVFTAKRRQRIVPVIPPVRNTTVDFTKTVSNLYIQSGDYEDIINKSIVYSTEKIRRAYLIDTHKLDDHFITLLHQKSGKSVENISKWVNLVISFEKDHTIANAQFLDDFNRATEKIMN